MKTITESVPHKCLICNGTGNVIGGYYQCLGNVSISSVASEVCRSCNGTGIIYGTRQVIETNCVLSPVVVEALQNDPHLKELYKRLGEINSTAIPIVVQVSPTEFKASYNDEFNELVTKLHHEINFRKDQIVSFYNR